jgi:TonB family protein
MFKRLAASASLAAALCLAALASAAPPAQGAQNSNRTPPPPRIVGTPGDVPPGDPKPPGGRDAPIPPPETAEADYDRVFGPREVTRRPVITTKPEPGFTEEARKNDVEGIVRLRAVLSKTGEVTNISVVKGLPDGLTEKAIAAARSIRFRPAQKDGRAVSQWVIVEYNFTFYIDDEDADKRAVIHEMPQPEYTEEARRQKVAGKVALLVMLHKDGRVSISERVEELPGGLTEKAVEAARLIKFTPARDGGRKVNVLRRVEYVFDPD